MLCHCLCYSLPMVLILGYCHSHVLCQLGTKPSNMWARSTLSKNVIYQSNGNLLLCAVAQSICFIYNKINNKIIAVLSWQQLIFIIYYIILNTQYSSCLYLVCMFDNRHCHGMSNPTVAWHSVLFVT